MTSNYQITSVGTFQVYNNTKLRSTSWTNSNQLSILQTHQHVHLTTNAPNAPIHTKYLITTKDLKWVLRKCPIWTFSTTTLEPCQVQIPPEYYTIDHPPTTSIDKTHPIWEEKTWERNKYGTRVCLIRIEKGSEERKERTKIERKNKDHFGSQESLLCAQESLQWAQ